MYIRRYLVLALIRINGWTIIKVLIQNVLFSKNIIQFKKTDKFILLTILINWKYFLTLLYVKQY